MKGMTLRRLCNVAYAVLIQSVPPEARAEFGMRLRGEHIPLAGGAVQPPEGHRPVEVPQPSREQIAAQNREAMSALMGMMPGAVGA